VQGFYSKLVLGREDLYVYLILRRRGRKRALIFLEEYLYALICEVLVGVVFMSSSGDNSVVCIIERDHPIISRKSCVIDVLLWKARRQGKEEELWRIFRPYSQSMDIDELDKVIEEIARLLGVKVEYRYI
jgi:hypothetical protein